MLEAKHDPFIMKRMKTRCPEEPPCDVRIDVKSELGPLDPSCGFASNSHGTLGSLVLWLSCANKGLDQIIWKVPLKNLPF